MNPVPRPMVFGAATILAGVCVLGLYLGIHGSLERPYADAETPASGAAAAAAAKPTLGAAAAIEAQPIQSDLPASAAPAKLADAKPKPKPAEDEDQSDEEAASSDNPAVQAHPPPEPPPLYPPIDQTAPSPQGGDNNAPPY